jgi:hypothetical protein
MRIFLTLLASLLSVGVVYGQQERTSAAPSEPSSPDAIKQFDDEKVAELSKQIAGKDKEDQPAEAVFKNIKILNGVPAGKLYADRLQPVSWRELRPLSSSRPMGKRRQTSQTNRSGHVENVSHYHF